MLEFHNSVAANCQKNHQHLNFYPIKQFKLEGLPASVRTQGMLDEIRDTALQTARIKTSHNSDMRPKPMMLGPPGFTSRVGTGRVDIGVKTLHKLPGYKPGRSFAKRKALRNQRT